MSDVNANGRSVLHKGDGLTQVSGPPDVCKTPSPGGPVPLPYPNAAMDKHLAKGTKQVKINGHPAAIASSNLSTSTGDEAGTAGGLISSKTKGKLTFASSSIDVSFEGKGVVRYGDITQHNGNTYNTVLAAAGEIAVAYGDDPIDGMDCPICEEPKAKHRLIPNDDIAHKAQKLRRALQDGPFSKTFVRGNPPNLRPLKKGVMIGVLSCQCETRKQYAGLAGTLYADGAFLAGANQFRTEAAKLGLIPVVDVPAAPPASGFCPPSSPGTGFGAISRESWADTQERVETVLKKHRGNPVLSCAAPKMIQRCLADGHKPNRLIEVWVALKSDKGVKVNRVLGFVTDDSTSPPGIKSEWLDGRVFKDAEPVPSCSTCQVTCSEMLCNTGKPPCP